MGPVARFDGAKGCASADSRPSRQAINPWCAHLEVFQQGAAWLFPVRCPVLTGLGDVPEEWCTWEHDGIDWHRLFHGDRRRTCGVHGSEPDQGAGRAAYLQGVAPRFDRRVHLVSAAKFRLVCHHVQVAERSQFGECGKKATQAWRPVQVSIRPARVTRLCHRVWKIHQIQQTSSGHCTQVCLEVSG